jgi:hypothetical protein
MTCQHIAVGSKKSAVGFRGIIVGRLLASCGLRPDDGVGLDNERGTGDHCHRHGQELPYTSATVDALVDYQGETLNFESPGAFFGRLTERRWALVTALLGQGALAVPNWAWSNVTPRAGAPSRAPAGRIEPAWRSR